MKVYLAYIDSFDENFYNEAVSVYPKNKSTSMLGSKNEKAKKESLLAWRIVARFCGDTGYIYENENGKPFFKKNDCFFSISHSDGAVIVATDVNDIGADVQKIGVRSDAVARRVMAPDELCEYEKAQDKAFYFTRLWTLRESYTKLCGSRISDNLKSLDFSSFGFEKSFSYRQLNFYSVRLGDFSLSLCSRQKIGEPDIISLSQSDF